MVIPMKTITLSADETLIEQAEAAAKARHTTLANLLNDWLREVAQSPQTHQDGASFYERLNYARSGGSFSREEMNER